MSADAAALDAATTGATSHAHTAGDRADTAFATLRAQGAAQREPLRWLAAQALQRRSQAQAGALRQRLDASLAARLADLQQRLAAAPTTATALAAAHHAPGPGPLALLLQHSGLATRPGAPPELRAVQQFGGTWARLRVDQQLAGAQLRQPENAGPLNSQRLALQTLQALRNLSPAYLQRFMAHAEALLWLEQAATSNAPPAAGKGRRGAAATAAAALPRRPARKAAP